MDNSVVKAFNGDRFIASNITRLIEKHSIQSVFETGTFEADTTEWLAKFSGGTLGVVSVELNGVYHQKAAVRLRKHRNVLLVSGSSPKAIADIAPTLKGNILFYLDAHWNDYNPLLDELYNIAVLFNSGRISAPVIAIHDWCVPGSSLGYDHFDKAKKIPYQYDLIQDAVGKIYSGLHTVSYNNDLEAEGARRGIIYIEPKSV